MLVVSKPVGRDSLKGREKLPGGEGEGLTYQSRCVGNGVPPDKGLAYPRLKTPALEPSVLFWSRTF